MKMAHRRKETDNQKQIMYATLMLSPSYTFEKDYTGENRDYSVHASIIIGVNVVFHWQEIVN